MRKKAGVIAILVTLIYWLGQAGGCSLKPANADEGTPAPLATTPAVETPVAPEATAPAMATTEAADETASVSISTAPARAGTGTSFVSGSAFDRSGWKKIVVGPVDGSVEHGELYFRDVPNWKKRPVEDPRTPFNEVFDRTDGEDAIIQPLKFAKDLVLLPVRFIFPSWREKP